MKTTITLHASMTDPTRALTFRDIDRRDRQHGLTKIGYHFVIERDGTTTAGRSLDEASVHDTPYIAKQSVSVCLIGGIDADGNPQKNFTEEQEDALFDLYHTPEFPAVTEVRAVTPSLTWEQACRLIGLRD